MSAKDKRTLERISRIERQEEEINELRAMVSALRSKALEVITSNSSNTGYEPSISVFQRDITELYNLHQSIPSQCLADVRADAVEKVKRELVDIVIPGTVCQPVYYGAGIQHCIVFLDDYAQQLREGAK